VERKVLIAVDGSVNALKAVRYVGRTFAPVEDFKVVLLHLLPAPPQILAQEARTDPASLKRLKTLEGKNRRQSEKVIGRAEEELARTGLTPDRIEKLVRPTKDGVAREIVFEAQNGLYDSLILGRRGLGRLQELFIGSVSQKCLQAVKSIPVWIVDGEAHGRKILIALDGSEDSFRAVDHVGFIAARHPELTILLLHVSSSLAQYCTLGFDEEVQAIEEETILMEEDYCMRNFFGQAREMLVRAGVPASRIEVRFQAKSMDIARSILQAAKEEDCKTIVVGRTGVSKARELFLGSVTNRLIQAAADRAVWVIV